MVYGKQKYKFSLEIEPKSSMYTSIIRYLATFPDVTNFFSNSYTNKDIDKHMPLMKIAYKTFKINFNDEKIKVIHKIKRHLPKGSHFLETRANLAILSLALFCTFCGVIEELIDF